MTRKCPNCGKDIPDESKFCLNCGYNFSRNNSFLDIFSNGKIFLILIAIILIIGSILILFSLGGNSSSDSSNAISESDMVDLTITEVNGYSSDNPTSYTFYVSALFNKVPNDLNGYQIRTTYYDENGTQLGQEIESLSSVYYDSDYSISFGYYTSYKKISADNVKVEIIKDGKVYNEYNETVDQNKISFYK